MAKGTIEEKMLELHRSKRELADGLLEGTDAGGRLTTERLMQVLREASSTLKERIFMKRVFVIAALLLGTAFAAPSGYDKSYLDTGVKPQDDSLSVRGGGLSQSAPHPGRSVAVRH